MLERCFSPSVLVIAGILLAGTARAGGAAVISVSAVVVSKSNCKFNNPRSTSIGFGTLDAGLQNPRVERATLSFTCEGTAPSAVYSFSTDDGLKPDGPGLPRMQHATEAKQYLSYSLELSPPSGTIDKGALGTLTLVGTITPANIANAIAGAFSDTVTITIIP